MDNNESSFLRPPKGAPGVSQISQGAPAQATQVPPTQPPSAAPPASTAPNPPQFEQAPPQPSGIEYNPDAARKLQHISELVTLGKVTHDVELFGLQFRFRSLTAGEQADATRTLAIMSPTSQAVGISIQILSRSIESVNGHPLESLYEYSVPAHERNPNHTIMDKRDAVIRSFSDTLVGLLGNEYAKVAEKSLEDVGASYLIKK